MRGSPGSPSPPLSRPVGKKANSNLTNEKVSRSPATPNLPVVRTRQRVSKTASRVVGICKKRKEKKKHNSSRANDGGRLAGRKALRRSKETRKLRNNRYPVSAFDDISADFLKISSEISPYARHSLKRAAGSLNSDKKIFVASCSYYGRRKLDFN